jgi:hypothetical protein
MANAGRFDFDQNLAGARSFKIDFGDFERSGGPRCDCGFNLHDPIPRKRLPSANCRGRLA